MKKQTEAQCRENLWRQELTQVMKLIKLLLSLSGIRQKTHTTSIRNEKGNHTTDSTAFKRKIIKYT